MRSRPVIPPSVRWLLAPLAALLLGALSPATIDPTPAPAAVYAVASEDDDEGPDVSYEERDDEGGARNVVAVRNRQDERMRVRGSVQLNRIPGRNVEPVNLATAYSSCTDCQSFSVALQIDLISRTAERVTPQNAAVAINEQCTRCVTVARALQYVVPVDDPTQAPHEVMDLIREMEREIRDVAQLGRRGDISVAEAEARINAVIARFRELGLSLYDHRREATEPTTPAP